MNNIEVKQEFWQLVDAVEERWLNTYSLDELEPSLLEVLNFVKKHPDSKQELEECFLELIQTPKGGVIEILEFCMHELRWPKIKQALENTVRTTKDIRERDALWRIPEAFLDNWDGVIFYKYYSRN